MKKINTLCFIIINYNGEKYLERYLNDISEICKNNNIDLFVTDDQSKDNSIKILKNGEYKFTVNNGRNHGYAANVNHGIKFAKKIGKYDFFIIANNDIKLSNGLFEYALPRVIDELSLEFSNLGLIGFNEVLEDKEEYFKSFDYINYKTNSIIEAKEIPGFCFIISSKLEKEIGILDEEYFMYGEDNDYFSRTKKAGYKIFATGLPIRHFSEGSSSDIKKTSWLVYRNALLYAQKNEGAWGVLRMVLAFVMKIYNPFYKCSHPSNLRVTRCGFLLNNYFLVKSILWNANYYINKKFKQLEI